MNAAKFLVPLALIALLALPRAFRPEVAQIPPGAERLVVITPHNAQIRFEFGAEFSQWHEARYGAPVYVDWRAPGGTSEIRRLLVSQFTSAARKGLIAPDGSAAPGVMSYDIFFGGGAYEFDVIKQGVRVELPGGEAAQFPMSVPAPFEQTQLDQWYGENVIGAGRLYDPDRHWLGAALTGFGIVYNRDSLRDLGLPEPDSWEDLTDHRYDSWLALTDPRHSGSVTTTYDAILNNLGWEDGWRTLRALTANARYFADSSLKAPIDVAYGEAAAGMSMGFYGRFQAQAMLEEGQHVSESRVGYVDPRGSTFIDADPIAILRAGPNPVIAARFVEFVLSDEGQALWQLPALGDDKPAGALGPRRHELRRLPVKRSFYERHRSSFVDPDIDPFAAASPTPSKGWRSMIAPLMSAFSIDVHRRQVDAWRAIHRARLAGADDDLLARLDELFYAMPSHELPDGRIVLIAPDTYGEVRNDWRDHDRAALLRIAYTRFFRENYDEVVRLVEAAGH